MAKKPAFEPSWVVSLMSRWVYRRMNQAIGYPKKSAGFSEKTTGGYNHTEPHDYCGKDFSDLECAIDRLREGNQELFAALWMHYLPWSIKGLQAEGWPFGNSTYYERLHRAHRTLAQIMGDKSKQEA